MLKHTEITKCK